MQFTNTRCIPLKLFLVAFIALLVANTTHANNSAAELYGQYCSVCHGDKGDGKSRAGGSMIPAPRDFTSPQSAIDLSRERMILSVKEGRNGTAMAGWKTQLDPAQIESIVDYIRVTMMRPVANTGSEDGRRLYAENCSVCHGDDGRGARWTITNLKPAPRNFTIPGTAEHLTEEHMLEVIQFGKADTAMPGFTTQLNREQIKSVIHYVRDAFMTSEMHSAPGVVQSSHSHGNHAPENKLMGNVNRGKAFYLENCTACHGENGDGKGPRAYFILPKPRNFKHPAAQNSLNKSRLFQAISEGTRGTDMPAWSKVLSDQDITDIAEYIYHTFIKSSPDDQSPTLDKG